jgi:quercetin dioxygenase-like cupin family protein
MMIRIDLAEIELEDNSTAGGPIRVGFPFHSNVGTGSSAAVVFELEPGSELATHTDSAEEVLLVLEGEGEARVGDEQERLSAGQLAVVPAMVPHSVANVGSRRLRVLGVFSSSTLVATFEEPLAPEGPQVMVIGAPEPIAVPLSHRAAV